MKISFHHAVLGFLGALILIAAPLPVRAQNAANTCAAQTKPIDIKLKTPKGQVVYNTRVSRNDLIRIKRSRSRGVQNSNWKPLGLTLSDFQFRIAASASLLPIAGNKFCVYPSTFDISVGYSGFKVYIDRRYGKGSCEYRAVLEHENTHVSIYRGHLARSKADLLRAAYSAARRIAPVIVSAPDQGARYVHQQMLKKLKPIVARIGRGADVANGRIDTVTSYKRVQARCRKW